jgi:hypothetical protein
MNKKQEKKKKSSEVKTVMLVYLIVSDIYIECVQMPTTAMAVGYLYLTPNSYDI